MVRFLLLCIFCVVDDSYLYLFDFFRIFGVLLLLIWIGEFLLDLVWVIRFCFEWCDIWVIFGFCCVVFVFVVGEVVMVEV